MRRLAALLTLVLAAAPLFIGPSTAVVAIGAAATLLCWVGIVAAMPVLVCGMVLALGEYTLALWLAGGPPRLGGAVLLGIVLVVLLETADFGRRAHRAAIGPGLLLAQIRAWAVFAAVTGTGALAVSAAAGVTSAAVRLPWAPAIAAVGAAVTLVGAALVLAGGRLPPRD